MKLYDYLDNEYVGLNIELQAGYDPYKKAHLESIHELLQFQKKLAKFYWFFRSLFGFVLCSLTGKFPAKHDLQAFLKEQAEKKAVKLQTAHSKDTECQSVNQIVS